MFQKYIAGIVLLIAASTSAQTKDRGWFNYSNKATMSPKIDLNTDFQWRSAKDIEFLETLLLRGVASYNFNARHSAGLGYAYISDWESPGDHKGFENRIVEQYLFQPKIKRTKVSLRARLEQRWVKRQEVAFSQRFRMFAAVVIPLNKDPEFKSGLFTRLQNEVFVNVQNQQKVNDQFYDQNRSLVALGYRWNKNLDTELGYQFWHQQLFANVQRSNVIQFMISTSF